MTVKVRATAAGGIVLTSVLTVANWWPPVVALAVAGRWAGIRPVRLGLGLAAYAVVTEILQAVLPIDRHGDVRDFLADAMGIVLGLLLSWLAMRVAQRASARG